MAELGEDVQVGLAGSGFVEVLLYAGADEEYFGFFGAARVDLALGFHSWLGLICSRDIPVGMLWRCQDSVPLHPQRDLPALRSCHSPAHVSHRFTVTWVPHLSQMVARMWVTDSGSIRPLKLWAAAQAQDVSSGWSGEVFRVIFVFCFFRSRYAEASGCRGHRSSPGWRREQTGQMVIVLFLREQEPPVHGSQGVPVYWWLRMASDHRLSACWYLRWFPGWRGVSWCSHLQMVLAVTPSSWAAVWQVSPIFFRSSARSFGGGSLVSGVSSTVVT